MIKIVFLFIIIGTTLNISAYAFDPERESHEMVDPVYLLLDNRPPTIYPSDYIGIRAKELNDLNAKLSASPNDAALYYERANFYFCEESTEQADSDYSKALELDPTMAKALYHRGKVREHRAYQHALKLGLTCLPKSINNYGVSAGGGSKNWDDAIKLAKMACLREPGNDAFRHNLSYAHYEMGCAYEKGMRFPKAAEQYQLAIDADPSCENGKERLKEFQRKHQITTAPRSGYPCDSQTLAEQAKLESKIPEYYAAAIKDFEATVNLIPKNSKPHVRLAKIAVKQKKPSIAIEEYSKAISLDGDTPQNRMCRAILYEKNENYEAALADINKAIEDIPKSKEEFFSYGPYKKLSVAEIEKGTAQQKKARDTEALGKASYLCGRIEAKQKKWNEALADLNKAIAIEKTDWEFFSERARVHKYLGNQDEAARDTQKALELEQGNRFSGTTTWGPIELFESDRYAENISSQKK